MTLINNSINRGRVSAVLLGCVATLAVAPGSALASHRHSRHHHHAMRSRGREIPGRGGAGCVVDGGGYCVGQCVDFVWTKRPELSHLGNATDWLVGAQKRGIPTGHTPAVGAVAWWSGVHRTYADSSAGHVAYVTAVGNGTVSFQEMNALAGPGRVDKHYVPEQPGRATGVHLRRPGRQRDLARAHSRTSTASAKPDAHTPDHDPYGRETGSGHGTAAVDTDDTDTEPSGPHTTAAPTTGTHVLRASRDGDLQGRLVRPDTPVGAGILELCRSRRAPRRRGSRRSLPRHVISGIKWLRLLRCVGQAEQRRLGERLLPRHPQRRNVQPADSPVQLAQGQ